MFALLAGEDSDLTSLLASKAAKRNDQSKSAQFCTSSASFRSAVGRADSDDEDVCNLASSPESDQGREHADNTPISSGSRGHPQRQSLSMQKGPGRRWSPESLSASLNRCLHSCSACNAFCHAHLWSCRVALYLLGKSSFTSCAQHLLLSVVQQAMLPDRDAKQNPTSVCHKLDQPSNPAHQCCLCGHHIQETACMSEAPEGAIGNNNAAYNHKHIACPG